MLPHQLEVLKRNRKRFEVLVWHRKARKTSTAIEKFNIEMANDETLGIKGVYWYISPSYGLAKETIWKDPNMLFRIIHPDLIDHVNESELTVFMKNGCMLSLKGADRPDLLRGPNPRGVVLDEYATMKAEVWGGVIQPIMRATPESWTWFIGTPAGRNHLFTAYIRGQSGHPEWSSSLLKASTSGIIDPEQLKYAKEGMTQALFNQEMECEFLEGVGSVFRKVREVATATAEEPKRNELYVMGVDLAKHQDYTVISVFNRRTRRQVHQDRFKNIEWPFQKSRIVGTAKAYNNAQVVLDATGLGDPIADDLMRAGVSVQPFKFTNSSKKELVEKLSIWIEQKELAILPLPESILELENFGYEMSSSGRIIYNAPSGMTDDIVMSIGLAVTQLNPAIKVKREREKSVIETEMSRRLDAMSGNSQSDMSEWAI